MSFLEVPARRDRLRALRRHDRRLQRDAVRGQHATLRWWKRRAVRPFRVLGAAWRAVRTGGASVRRATGMSLARQFVDVVVVGLRWGTPAYVWYRLALFRPERRAEAAWFLHHMEHDRLLSALAERERDRWAVLDDKRTFADWAASRGLPANPPLATVSEGVVRQPADSLPADDLVLKAADGGGGRDLEFLLVVDGARPTRWATAEGEQLDADGVSQRLVDASADGPHVLERRLRPHAVLAELGVGLCTVRLVTARVGDDEPTVVATVLGIPARPDAVDNFTAGGLAAPVDPATGALRPASTIHADRAAQSHTHHPLTGAAIAGRVLPGWSDVLELAVAAHRAAAGVTSVGWDVGLTAGGPLLLEANMTWNGEMPQVLGAPPLGRTAWLDIVTEALGV